MKDDLKNAPRCELFLQVQLKGTFLASKTTSTSHLRYTYTTWCFSFILFRLNVDVGLFGPKKGAQSLAHPRATQAKERPKPRNDYLDCYTGPKVKWEDWCLDEWSDLTRCCSPICASTARGGRCSEADQTRRRALKDGVLFAQKNTRDAMGLLFVAWCSFRGPWEFLIFLYFLVSFHTMVSHGHQPKIHLGFQQRRLPLSHPALYLAFLCLRSSFVACRAVPAVTS